MEIGEVVAPPSLVDDLEHKCPFPHDMDDPPTVSNNIVGVGGTLKTRMGNGTSTNLYGPYKPTKGPIWGEVPQERPGHAFNGRARCIEVEFDDGTRNSYPCSCSAHHLIPAQESLKGHKLLQYMCEEGTSADHNHGYSAGRVWSDAGYDTNGSENGVYLPGSYAVGGGRAGLRCWYPYDDEDDSENGYVEVDKMPLEDDPLLHGKKGEIADDNGCWAYVAKAMKAAPGQFHDRHQYYSEQVVAKALDAIYAKYVLFDITIGGQCSECEDRKKKIEDQGLPAPYSIVYRLKTLSANLRRHLNAQMPKTWRRNIYTSQWVDKYMKAVIAGGDQRAAAERFE